MVKVIGLNSGSSFDGIDVALVEIETGGGPEAIKFATLAHATMNGLANSIPAASGATRFGILGKLVQPPRLAKV